MRIIYRLRSRGALKYLMEHPGRGAPYSVRALAEAAGVPRATVGHLLTGRTLACEVYAAHRIARALGVAPMVLFAAPASPDQDDIVEFEANREGDEEDGTF